MVNIGTSLFFAEISGSAVADVAALGSVLIPEMKRKGYPGPFAAAVTSSSASLAIIIPPSIPMILYAVMADSSVVQLFVAGIVPGLLGGLLLMATAYWFAVRQNYPVEELFELAKLWRPSRKRPGRSCCRSSSGRDLRRAGDGHRGRRSGGGRGAVRRWCRFTESWIGRSSSADRSRAVCRPRWSCCWLPPRRWWGSISPRAQSPAAARQAIGAWTRTAISILALLNVFFLLIGLFSAFGGRHHSRGAHRRAPGLAGRDRPGAFRHHRHPESCHRSANAAGGQRAGDRVLGRQRGHLARLQR